jgi:DNA-binding MarR family transcriptional regulator
MTLRLPLGICPAAAHKYRMDEQSGKRLAAAISALIGRFKVGAQATPYEDITLTDAAVVSSLSQAAEEGREPIQKEVSAALGLPKTTMTSAVKRLSARGLVEQGSGTSDARARTLHLTAEGRKLASRMKEAQIRASMAILESLPARDQPRLIELLERVVAKSAAGTAPIQK